MAKSRAFQLAAEEARATPDIMTGMCILLISLFILIIVHDYVFYYRIIPCERYI